MMFSLAEFMIRWGCFLVVNLLMFLAALSIVMKFSRSDLLWSEICSNALVLFFFQIVITEILLGLVGSLYWWSTLLVNFAIAGCVFWVFREHLASFRSILGKRLRKLSNEPILGGVVVVFGVMVSVMLYTNLRRPPFGTDSLEYHLPIAVEWLQTGHIIIKNPIPWNSYPAVSELFLLWLMLPFHSDLLANLQNLPFFAVAVLSLYSLARKLELSPRWAAYSALFFFGIRTVQLQLGYVSLQDNDILVASFFLFCLNLAARALQMRSDRFLAVLQGIGLGLLVGTKYSGLGYALLVFALYLFQIFFIQERREILSRLSLLILAGLLSGLFWYVRNFLQFGSPLHPMNIRLRGSVVFSQVASFPRGTSLLANFLEPGALYMYAEQSLLRHVGLLSILSVPLLLLLLLPKPRKWILGMSGMYELVVIFVLCATLFLNLITPFGAENAPNTLNQLAFGYSPVRYGLSFWALCGVLVALFLQKSALGWLGEMTAVAIIFHSAITLLHYQREFALFPLSSKEGIVFLGFLLTVWVVRYTSRIMDRRYLWVFVFLFAFSASGGYLYLTRREGIVERRLFYNHKLPGYIDFEDSAKTMGSNRITLVGYNNFAYVFIGPQLERHVVFCPGKPEEWVQCVRAQEVDLVVSRQEINLDAMTLSKYGISLSTLHSGQMYLYLVDRVD